MNLEILQTKNVRELSSLIFLSKDITTESFTEPILEPVINFTEPFSWHTHFQNRFTKPVQYRSYVSLHGNVEMLRSEIVNLNHTLLLLRFTQSLCYLRNYLVKNKTVDQHHKCEIFFRFEYLLMNHLMNSIIQLKSF